jgi:hypothetical protein
MTIGWLINDIRSTGLGTVVHEAAHRLVATADRETGSEIFRRSGTMDNVKPMIENIERLSAADRKKIFEDNARAVFKLKVE